MSNQHLTNDALQVFVDGRLPSREASIARRHLQNCETCQRAHAVLSAIDADLKRQPLISVSDEFSTTVMKHLGLGRATSISFRFVEGLAYAFGLMIVIGITLVVLYAAGIIGASNVERTRTLSSELFARGYQGIAWGVAWLTNCANAILPVAGTRSAMTIAVCGLVVVGLLAMLDRFVQRRALERLW